MTDLGTSPAASTAGLRTTPGPAGEPGKNRESDRATTAAVARGGLINMVGAGFAGLSGFVVTWLVARALDSTSAGAFFASTAAFVLIGAIAKLGTQTSMVYYPARLRTLGDTPALRACLRAGLWPVGIVSTIMGVAMWVFADPIASFAVHNGHAEYAHQLRLLAVFLPVSALSDAVLSATRGWRAMRPTVMYDRILRPGLQVGILAVLFVLHVDTTAAFVIAWAAPWVPSTLLAARSLIRLVRRSEKEDAATFAARSVPAPVAPARIDPAGAQTIVMQAIRDDTIVIPAVRDDTVVMRAIRDDAPPPGPLTGSDTELADETPVAEADAADARPATAYGPGSSGFTTREFWKFTWPRAFASVLQLSLQRVDVLLLASIAGLKAAAIYTVAGRFILLGQFANQGIYQAVQPRLAERLAIKDRRGANQLYQISTTWLILCVWPAYLLIAVYAKVYLKVLGGGYSSGASVVIVLAVAGAIAIGCGMVDTVLAMAGKSLWNLMNVSVALVTQLTIDVLVIPHLGPLGAAFGLGAALLINNVVPLIQIAKAFGIHPFGKASISAASLSMVCFGAVPLGILAVLGNGVLSAAIATIVAGILYLAGLWKLRSVLQLDAFKQMRKPFRRS